MSTNLPTYAFAFFDADETILNMKSMLDFLEFHWTRNDPATGHGRFARLQIELRRLAGDGESRATLNAFFYASLTGEPATAIEENSGRWYREKWQGRPDRFLAPVADELRRLAAAGCQPVLVSGSFAEVLAPFAAELGVGYVLCSRPEIAAGVYTGRLLEGPMIGPAKMHAVQAFLADKDVSPRDCIAFGDSGSDIPMLSAVGEQVVVNPDRELEEHALWEGWRIVRTSPGRSVASF